MGVVEGVVYGRCLRAYFSGVIKSDVQERGALEKVNTSGLEMVLGL